MAERYYADQDGFADLCKAVHRDLILQDHRLVESFSELEFILANTWILNLYELQILQSKLVKKGMDLKSEGLCDSFQLRGDRMIIIKDGLVSAFYKASIVGETLVIVDDNETEAGSYFPPVLNSPI